MARYQGGSSHCCCSALNCSNGRHKEECQGLSFFKLPTGDEERCKIWIQNAGRFDMLKMSMEDVRRGDYHLCSDHFDDHQFNVPSERKRLVWNAVPTIFKVLNSPPPIPLKRKLKERPVCESHTEKRHLDSQKDSLQCKYCLTVLDNRVYLEAHLHNAHGQSLEQDSVLSKLTVFNNEQLPHHEEKVSVSKSVHGYSSGSAMNSRDRKENRCSVCGKTFTLKSSLKRHMQKHTADGCLKCDLCDKTFACRRTLDFHLISHKSLKCFHFQCSEIFHDRQQLLTHVRSHFKDNEICRSSLHKEEDLLIDNNECIPEMVLKDTSKEEMFFGGKLKPYKCAHCARAYCYKKDLRRHHVNCHPQLEYCA